MSSSRGNEEPPNNPDAKYQPNTSSGRGSGFRGRGNSKYTPYPGNHHRNEVNRPQYHQKPTQWNPMNNSRNAQNSRGYPVKFNPFDRKLPALGPSKNGPIFGQAHFNSRDGPSTSARDQTEGNQDVTKEVQEQGKKIQKVYLIGFKQIEQICSDLDSGKMFEGSCDLLKVVQSTDFHNRLENMWPGVPTQIKFLRVIVAAASNGQQDLTTLTCDFMVKVMKSSLIETLISQHICGDEPHVLVNPRKRTSEHADLIDQLLTLLMIGLDMTPTWIDRLLVTVDGKMITYLKKACASFPEFLNAKTQKKLNHLEDAIQEQPNLTADGGARSDDEPNLTLCTLRVDGRAEGAARQLVLNSSRGLPPENFRTLSVIPEHKDFEEGGVTAEQRKYLRPNIEKGKFNDEEHYLDVHFRLLREDLIRPLRVGIYEYRQQILAQQRSTHFKPAKKLDLYVYRDVQVSEAELQKQSGQLLNYMRLKTHKNMRWNKKLIYGSLVCLSSDHFNRNLIFGVVQDRDEKMLWKGQVGLKLENPGQLDTSVLYCMVESPAFFEAYKHVMLSMQNIRLNGPIPYARYFVHARTETEMPKYIRNSNGGINFDVMLKKNRPIETARALSSNIALLGESIKAEDWGMDQSQFEALKYALSNELVVMQGPPGTGKTFLGLQLTRILLANQQLWNSDHRPVLVVCYTNHALDQFLEGISQSLKNGIVRIGGRCKNAALERFMLHNVRREFNEARRLGPRDYAADKVRFELVNTRNLLKTLQQEIEKFAEILPQLETHVVSPGALCDIFRKHDLPYYERLKQFLEKDQFMFHWLTQSKKLAEINLSTLLTLHEYGFPEIKAKNAAYVMFKYGVDSAEEIASWIMLEEQRGRPVSNTLLHPDIRHWPKFGDIDRICIHPIVAAEMLSSADSDINAVLTAHRRHRNIPETNEGNRQNIQNDAETTKDINEGEMDEEFLLNTRDETADNRMLYAPADLDDIFVVKSKAEKKANNNWFDPELMKLYAPLIKTAPAMSDEEAQIVEHDIWKLPLQDRWRLYQYWINMEHVNKTKELKELEEEHAHNIRKYCELQSLADVEVLRCAKVIGMTTTGAAKHQATLLSLKPRIVIVEEAAEVLEAHLLACLTLACEHFILIGDHQQLRPNPAVYELAKDYKLDLSLFERLINNGYPYRALKRQHRMHPEISRVLMPHFYPDLEDDPSVERLPEVMGVPEKQRLLFINHSHPEESPSEIKSHSNIFEVIYSVRLAFYFIQQGYKPDQVTILCTYLDQLLELRKRAKIVLGQEHKVRIENVDNYQGEECDIIILSLVRSNNPDNKIGYLKTPNRVCVALSRAKIGLYVLGNIDFLSKRSDLWMEIRKSVEEAGALSKGTFPVKCQMHGVEQVIESFGLEELCQMHGVEQAIEKWKEFDKKCPEGGCDQPCNVRRDCGHTCNKMCHAYDLDHEEPCRRPCQKACNSEFQHPCKKLCYEECGACEEKVVKQLPCRHSKLVECALPASLILCHAKCTRLLSCTHPCQLKCSDKCDSQKCSFEVERMLPGCNHRIKMKCSDDPEIFKCNANVLKRWPICGHEVETNCSTDVNTTLCPKPCSTPLAECEHLCLGTCGKCRNGRIHVACKEDCKRILICGHECKSKCSKICPPCDLPCETACGHSQCGQVAVCGEKGKKIRKSALSKSRKNKGRTCGELCPKCVEKCHNQCEHRQCDLPCWMPCKVPPCQEPCNKILPCSPEVDEENVNLHKCIGVCGEECLSICKICHPKEFEEIKTLLFGTEDDDDARFVRLKDCGHIFEVTGLDRWIQIETAAPEASDRENSSESASTAVSIVPIVCPQCKTPIKRSSRYISALNKRACDIDQIKYFNRGKTKEELKADLKTFNENKLEPFIKEVQNLISHSAEHYDVYTSFESLFTQLKSVNVQNITVHWINTARNVLRIAEQLQNLLKTVHKEKMVFSFDTSSPEIANATNELRLFHMVSLPANKYLYAEIDYLLRRLGNDNDVKNIAEMTLAQIAQEADRLSLLKDLMNYLGEVYKIKNDFVSENKNRLHRLLEGLHGNKEFVGEHRDALKQQFKELVESHQVQNFGISEAERIQIVKAVGYDVRKWYKCSKGHLYGIGDCGMAMVQSQCPVCKEVIGGSDHRLVSTSRDATDEFRDGVAPLRPVIPPEFLR
ncbi:AAA domain-containing protein [Ditylenchus destructor]|uniref:AAA domain-containing protein n=1 Tax=Ditylenchus destructor TaxID=166010 RepID=A0AAD4N630_9BILA|nr:AAA domain-containing protein [Ditylenchus destructor]